MVYHVLNLGAGVQSTTLYLFAIEKLLHFDYAIFADTQEEPKRVYDHLNWLQTLGGPQILIRTKSKLGDDLLNGVNSTGQRFTPIPAYFKNENGKVSISQRQCTAEYKIRVCDKTIRRDILKLKPRQKIPKNVIVIQYYGISTDEAARAERAKKRFERTPWTKPVYPLIEINWSRKDCIEYLRSRVPHAVPKSSCVFCPYKTNQDWLSLKNNDPDAWDRAVEIDEAIRTNGRKKELQLFVHKDCVPLRELDFSQLQPNTIDPMSVNECLGMCGL